MDKNSITGIVLIMAMLLGYQYFFAPKEDTIKPKAQVSVIAKQRSANKAVANGLPTVTLDSSVKEQIFVLENKISFDVQKSRIVMFSGFDFGQPYYPGNINQCYK